MMMARGGCLRKAALLVMSAALASHAPAYAGPMSLDGQFQVNEGGAAVYTIPLQLVPGIAGMEPKVSLTYNSQGGNGPLGIGWSLSTQSAITRCPPTLAQDNARGPVDYLAWDRFCLDGQRLILVSGTYGAADAVYRTERDGFSKIISYGTGGIGPSYFKVWTKSGQIIEYGNTTDSKVLPVATAGITAPWAAGTVRYWAINKVSDTKGNSYSYSYSMNGGEAYVAQISYTATESSASFASVRFVYETRTDTSTSYHRGGFAQSTRRLKSVQMYEGENLVREYPLAYTYGVATKRSRLASIKECSPSASVGPCLPPVTFAWRDTSVEMARPSYESPVLPATVSGYPSRNDTLQYMQTGDFNGDGRTDYLYLPEGGDGRWLIAYGSENGLIAPDYESAALPTKVNGYMTRHSASRFMQFGDFNGDGRTDYMYIPEGGDGRWLIAYGISTRLSKPPYDSPALPASAGGYLTRNSSGSFMRVGDFNGDGRSDYMYIPQGGDGRWLIAYGTADGLTTPDYESPALPATVNGYKTHASVARYMRWGDYNGDGRTDYMYVPDGGDGRWLIAYGLESRLSKPPYDTPALPASLDGYKTRNAEDRYMQDGDFNGDGKSDYMYMPADSDGRWLIAYGTGFGFTLPSYASPALPSTINDYVTRNGYAPYMKIGDFNGDGRSDYMFIPHESSAGWLIAYGTATGMTHPNPADPAIPRRVGGYASYSHISTPQYMQLGDFDGDGRTDYLYIPADSDGRVLMSHQVSSTFPDLLTTITTGQGATVDIFYLPLTDSNVYARGGGVSYPVMEIQPPMYVANKVTASNGTGGSQSTNYKYFYLKAEAGTGRGLLGFGRADATQTETQILTRTYYSQIWPYIGLPTSASKYLPGSGNADLLSQTIYTHACQPPSDGTSCSVGYGKYYFPYVSKSVESSWDLSGAALPVVTTETEYDKFGNAIQVRISTDDGYSKTTTNAYMNDEANWFLGRLIRSTVTSVTP